MVNDPSLEREDIRGDEPVGDPGEAAPRQAEPDDVSGLEREGRESEERGVGPIEETLPARP